MINMITTLIFPDPRKVERGEHQYNSPCGIGNPILGCALVQSRLHVLGILQCVRIMSFTFAAATCRPVLFRPEHKSKLANEFWLYTNVDTVASALGGYDLSP